MNKPIIIDGVDVSECKEIRNYDYLLIVCGITGMKCQLNTNCLYKQLQRLKAKNEELKKKLNEVLNDSEILHENNCLRIANIKLNEDLSQTETSLREWKKENEAYKQALEEIKEITKKYYLSQIKSY